MNTVTSKDGTTIAFEQLGQGAPVILVDGAMVHRGGQALAAELAKAFTVILYDRRGRGDSSDTLPFAVEREIEDLEAVIDSAGGSAFVYGISSGGALAMQAAVQLGDKVKKLAIYEVPYNDDAAAQQVWHEYRKNLGDALAENRRSDAVALFMKQVGVPDSQIAGMRQAPFWQGMEAIAPTLLYDAVVLGEWAAVPLDQAARVSVPALVINGGASHPFMRVTALALAGAMLNAQHRTLEGQTHDVQPEALAPVLLEFFGA